MKHVRRMAPSRELVERPRRIYEQADGLIVPLERLHEFLIAQGWYLPRQTLRWMGDLPQAQAAVKVGT